MFQKKFTSHKNNRSPPLKKSILKYISDTKSWFFRTVISIWELTDLNFLQVYSNTFNRVEIAFYYFSSL